MALTNADTAVGPNSSEWLDRNSGRIMVLPAVLILLLFAIFPLIVSAYLSLSRFALAGGSFRLTFVGNYNFRRLLAGVQQYHLVGTFKPMGLVAWSVFAVFAALAVGWLVRFWLPGINPTGFIGRLVAAGLGVALVFATLGTSFSGGVEGTLLTTLLYAVVGVSAQFLLGLGLVLLCAQPIRQLKLLDTQLALISTYTAVNLPIVVWLTRDFFAGIPLDLKESAEIDGASKFRVFFTIALPLVRSGLAATFLLILIRPGTSTCWRCSSPTPTPRPCRCWCRRRTPRAARNGGTCRC